MSRPAKRARITTPFTKAVIEEILDTIQYGDMKLSPDALPLIQHYSSVVCSSISAEVICKKMKLADAMYSILGEDLGKHAFTCKRFKLDEESKIVEGTQPCFDVRHTFFDAVGEDMLARHQLASYTQYITEEMLDLAGSQVRNEHVADDGGDLVIEAKHVHKAIRDDFELNELLRLKRATNSKEL